MKWSALVTIIFAIAASFASSALAQNCGRVSDGSCNCKTQCDGGRSSFSRGHTVAQCRAMCVRTFSGCTRGQIRCVGGDLPTVRPQRAAPSAAPRSAAARPAGARQRISCDRFGCHHHVQSWQPIPGRNCVAVPHGNRADREGWDQQDGLGAPPILPVRLTVTLASRLWPVCITTSELSGRPNRPPPVVLPCREAVACGHSMATICCSGRRYSL